MVNDRRSAWRKKRFIDAIPFAPYGRRWCCRGPRYRSRHRRPGDDITHVDADLVRAAGLISTSSRVNLSYRLRTFHKDSRRCARGSRPSSGGDYVCCGRSGPRSFPYFGRATVDKSDVGFMDKALAKLLRQLLVDLVGLATTISPDVSLSSRWTMPTLNSDWLITDR